MIEWKNKEPGYYTPEGELIWTWSQLKERRMIAFDEYGEMYKKEIWFKHAYFLEPKGGILVFASNVKYVMKDAFKHSHITGIVLNEGLKELWDRAFCEAQELEFVVFSSTIESIGRSAFRSCYNLKNIEIKSPITQIEGLTFKYCHSLETIKIESPELTYIDEESFAFCTKMHTCIINAPIKHIGMEAFYRCDALKHYNKLTTPKFIHGWAFSGSPAIDDVVHKKYESYFDKNGITDESERERISSIGINAVDLLLNY